MPNITLSADKALIDKARRVAQQQGKSLNEMVRAYLRSLVGEAEGTDPAEELLELMTSRGGHSGGRPWKREDAYEGRLE